MPSPIDSVGQLVAVIRAQLSNSATAKNGSTPIAAARRKVSSNSASGAQKKLEPLIRQRIQSIHRDDPKRGRKAFRAFLESILLSHFGEQLINDPQFYQLVDDIQSSMEADPEIKELVDAAIRRLLKD